MCQSRDFIMAERHDAMSGSRLRCLVRLFRMLEGLPGMLMPSLMFRLALLFTGAVGVGGQIVQFGSPLMIFVRRSVVVSSRHDQRVTICPDFVWASLASL